MGILFDKFCDAVESKLPPITSQPIANGPATTLRQLMRVLPLFEINTFPACRNDYTEEDMAFQNDQFVLPFSSVAIEDESGLVILSDTEPGQIGLSIEKTRKFINVRHTSLAPINDPSGGKDKAELEANIARNGHSLTLTFGNIALLFKTSPEGNKQAMAISSDTTHGYVIHDNGTMAKIDPTRFNVEWQDANSFDIQAGFQEAIFINSQNHFIIKEFPEDLAQLYRKADTVQKLLRSKQRPIYTVLTPGQIKIKYGLHGTGAATGVKRAPHLRRRHYRCLTSDHFTHKQGQVITIPSTWIGPSEGVEGRRRYKVMLNL